MDYDNGLILQKTMVSTNRSVDWSLLRSSSARLLPKGCKNDGKTISCSGFCFVLARKVRKKQ